MLFSLGFSRWFCSCASPGGWRSSCSASNGCSSLSSVRGHSVVRPVVGGRGDMWSRSIALSIITVVNSILNIVKSAKGETSIALEGTDNGCHWTLLFFKRNSPVWYYGDSLGWPFPLNSHCLEDIVMQAEIKYGSKFIAPRVQCLPLIHWAITQQYFHAILSWQWIRYQLCCVSEQQSSCTVEPVHTFHYKRSGKDQEMQDVSDSDPRSVAVSDQQHSYREPQDNENSCSTHTGYSTDNESLYDFDLKSCKSKHILPESAFGLSNPTSLTQT